MFKIKNRLHLFFVLAIALFSTFGVMAFIDAEKAKDIEEIERVVTVGHLSAYHSGMLPQEYRDNPNLKVPASVVEATKRSVKEELEKYYDVNSNIYRGLLECLTESVEGEAKTKERHLGDGIKKVEKLDINLDGNTAKVEMIAIVEGKHKVDDGTVFAGKNKVKYNFELKKIDGKWKITSEEFTLPEGI